MCPLRWTLKSTRVLAKTLQEQGHRVSHQTVATLLHRLGYSLQKTQKMLAGDDEPDRDVQFQYIHDTVKDFIQEEDPIISVDCKKKELIGDSVHAQRNEQKYPLGISISPEELDAVNIHRHTFHGE